ncbi:MAG: hypothetical protein JOZ55_05345 [Alphaproteobacteria bacterium]|nr:hypothetical protein [Alphaproteobacteria bacterium]
MRPSVHGIDLDAESRCHHWHSPLDIVAIKMKCCARYYACRQCHDALEQHSAKTWEASERGEKAVLCGACGEELTIADYLAGGDACPVCKAAFNPGCRSHRHFYFSP